MIEEEKEARDKEIGNEEPSHDFFELRGYMILNDEYSELR